MTLQRLLFCLLKIISISHESQSLAACETLLSLMKKNNTVFDSFRPNKQLLTQMNFRRLLDIPEDSSYKAEEDSKQIVFDLMTFILRYYSDVGYEDYGLDELNLDLLKKEEVKRIWITIDKVIQRYEHVKKNFKERNKLTARALGEILSYVDNFKKAFDKNSNSKSVAVNTIPTTKSEKAKSEKSFDGNTTDFGKKSDPEMTVTPRNEEKEKKFEDELKTLRQQLNQMRDSLGQSQELFRSSMKKFQRVGAPEPIDSKREIFSNSMVTEILEMRKKYNKLEITLESLESSFNRLNKDNKNRFMKIQENIQTELDSLKLFKDRVQLEVEILGNKKERSSTGLNSMRNSTQSNANYLAQQKDIDFLMKEFKRMQMSIERLEINQNPNSKSSKNKNQNPTDTYINDVSMKEITDFIKEQRRINFELKSEISSKKSSKNTNNPLTKGIDETPAEVRLRREMNDVVKSIKSLSGKVAIVEKDILSITEIQRIVVGDVENLKIDRDSRFKTEGFKLNIRRSQGNVVEPGSFEENLQTEITNLRMQNESLFEKNSVNNSKIMRLQAQLMDVVKENSMKKDNLSQKQEIALNARFDKYERDLGKLNEKIEKANYDLSKEMKNFSMTGIPENSKKGSSRTRASYNIGNREQITSLIQKETEHIFHFIQEFVNEMALYNTSIIKSEEKAPDDKMDSIDWFARNIEFVSTHIFEKFVESCKDIRSIKGPSTAKTSLYHSQNKSTVLLSLKRLIIETQDQNASSGVKRQLPHYLRLLNICFMNVYNCEKARNLSLDQLLINVLVNKTEKGSNITESSYNLAKECLSLLVVNNINIMHKLISKEYFCRWLARTEENGIMHESSEMEKTHLPVYKILECAFKSSHVSEELLKENQSLVNELIKSSWKSYSSGDEEVLLQNLKTIRQFSKQTSLLENVSPPEMIQILIDLSNDCPNIQAKRTIYETLKNFMGKRQFSQIIRNSGVMDMVQKI